MATIQKLKLNAFEKVMYEFNLIGDESVIGIAIIEPEDPTQVTQDVVKKALFYMLKRHPLLSAHLRSEIPTEPYIEVSNERNDNENKIDFEWTIMESKTELTRELEKFNMILFDYANNCRLWRFKVMQYLDDDNKSKLTFALVIPHFITDGINISVLLMEIVNLINAQLTNTECEEMHVHFEPCSDIVELSEKNGFWDKDKEAKMTEELKTTEEYFFSFDEKFHNPNDLGAKINLLALDESTSRALVIYAKSNGIKLNGFLLAALYYSIKKLYDENDLKLQKNFSALIPVNLRMRFTPKMDFGQLRLFISIIRVNLKYPDFGKYEDIWKDAELINRLVQKEIRTDNGEILKEFHRLQFSEEEQVSNESIDSSSRRMDFAFSNVGIYLNEKKVNEGPLKLAEIYHGDGLQSNPTAFASLIVHTSTWNNRLMFQFSSNRRTFGAKYSDRFVQILKDLITNSILS